MSSGAHVCLFSVNTIMTKEKCRFHPFLQNNSTVTNTSLPTTPAIYAYDPDFGLNATIFYSIEGMMPPLCSMTFLRHNNHCTQCRYT